MASVTARLARALHECNISDAAWLPRSGFLPGGSLVAVLARTGLMAFTAVMGTVAIVA